MPTPTTASAPPPMNQKNQVEHKTVTLNDVKLDTTGAGTFKGYASTFHNEDLQGDIVMPGAFKRTIQNNGGVFRLLDQHNPDIEIGIVKATEDATGLLIDGEFYIDPSGDPTKEVRAARETYVKMQRRQAAGMPLQFSIGYRAINPRFENGKRLLTEVALAEVSTVTFPANPQAVTTSVKSHDDLAKAFGDTYAQAVQAEMPWKALEIAHEALEQSIWDAILARAPIEDALTQLNTDLNDYASAVLANVQAILQAMQAGKAAEDVLAELKSLKAGRVLSAANVARAETAMKAMQDAISMLEELLSTADSGSGKAHPDDAPAKDDPDAPASSTVSPGEVKTAIAEFFRPTDVTPRIADAIRDGLKNAIASSQ